MAQPVKGRRKRWTVPEHRGRLTPAQAAEGINHLRDNSFRLMADAAFMFMANRYSTCVLLSVLAIEEAGKRTILQEITVARSTERRKELWSEWRNHSPKVSAALSHLTIYHVRTIVDRKTFEELSRAIKKQLPQDITRQKELATYVHCLPRVQWSVPSEHNSKTSAIELLAAALAICRLPKVTETEVRLWAKHIVSARGTTFARMRKAFISYHTALVEAGLSVEDRDGFLNGLLDDLQRLFDQTDVKEALTSEARFETVRALIPQLPVDKPPSARP
jgi:AbiV family abortive infection protein